MRRALIVWILAVLALELPLAGTESVGDGPVFIGLGTPVVSVTFRGLEKGEAERTARTLVEIPLGVPLTQRAVRATLLNLQASGDFGASEVWLRTDADGAEVTLVVAPKLRVASVGVRGETCLRRSTLQNRLQQAEGAPLSESRILRGVYRLEETLAAEGFPDAEVKLEVAVDDVRGEASVAYTVECGDPMLVEAVRMTGELGPFSSEDLESKLRMGPGKQFKPGLVSEDGERLRSWLFSQGYLEATVASPKVDLGAMTTGVRLEYRLGVGPRFEISVAGADERVLRRKKLLEVLERESFDEALLLQVVDGIHRFYQEEGHYRVQVEWNLERLPDAANLEIQIRKGPVFEIGSLVFRGNDTVDSAELAARLATGPRAVFGASGRLVDAVLAEDLANLSAYYARAGFPAAKVGPCVIEEDGSDLRVVVPIEEGPQERLVSLDFVGVKDPEVRTALGRVAMAAGGPFHRRLLEELLDEIRATYESAGYLWAQVAAELTSAPASGLKNVTVEVLEGPKVRAGRVVLRGNVRTRDSVILRGLGIGQGDAISRRRLLDAQRSLYRLSIFESAEVRLAPGVPFSPQRDVLVKVEEGRSQRASFGLGYDSEDGVRSLLGYSHASLWGRAVSARIDLRVSEREEQFRALVRQPFVGSRRLPVTYSLFAVEEEQESFDSRRRGAQVEAHRQADDLRLGLLYTYKIVEVLENSDVQLFRLGIDRNLQEVEISSLTPSLFLDRRDDLLLPTRGWTFNLQAELAVPTFSAEAEFVKIFGQQTQYWPLDEWGVLAGSLRLGGVEPRGGSVAAPASVPISEQFFAGGRTTHRAYRRDLLGVLGETLLLCNPESGVCAGAVPPGDDANDYRFVPVGGNGLLLLNLDYRFPIAGPVGGTVFVDAGNVWSEWSDFDPREVKVGAGLGVRYASPIGPLRLEVGWKLDRLDGESASVVSLSFGNPF